MTPITSRGYVSIAAGYRLTGVAKWPAQIEDLKAAIQWAHANAGSLGIDPQRIATVGYSAGGSGTQLPACSLHQHSSGAH